MRPYVNDWTLGLGGLNGMVGGGSDWAVALGELADFRSRGQTIERVGRERD